MLRLLAASSLLTAGLSLAACADPRDGEPVVRSEFELATVESRAAVDGVVTDFFVPGGELLGTMSTEWTTGVAEYASVDGLLEFRITGVLESSPLEDVNLVAYESWRAMIPGRGEVDLPEGTTARTSGPHDDWGCHVLHANNGECIMHCCYWWGYVCDMGSC